LLASKNKTARSQAATGPVLEITNLTIQSLTKAKGGHKARPYDATAIAGHK
jgi:hypothetical protein